MIDGLQTVYTTNSDYAAIARAILILLIPVFQAATKFGMLVYNT